MIVKLRLENEQHVQISGSQSNSVSHLGPIVCDSSSMARAYSCDRLEPDGLTKFQSGTGTITRFLIGHVGEDG